MKEKPDYFELQVHGRILEHLGIQMYERPVNALAELVANAWDADAETVKMFLPEKLSESAEIVVEDDGIGMTPEECESQYLYVGWNRRGDNLNAVSLKLERKILGRKGIGKFAGFGIAEIIQVETISEATGERTVFALDLNELMGEDYIGGDAARIPVLEYEPPSDERKGNGSTKIVLKNLRLKQKIRSDFPESMARRFLMLQRQADFKVFVNNEPLPEALALERIQFSFPQDYKETELPSNVTEVDNDTGWGRESLPNGREIKWRVMFHKDTIDEEELRGVTVFAKEKLVQAPFLFHLTGGLSGQHGVEYLTGQIQADFLDSLQEDIITTERQRVNWGHEEASVLLNWGQERIKQLLRIWRDRRAESRKREIENKIRVFSGRIEKLPPNEAKTVTKAIEKLGGISTLGDAQFEELGSAVLTAWEHGRVRGLIDHISGIEDFSETELVGALIEQDIISALNIAEAVKTKILAVGGLKHRIEKKELELAVRDYIAENPWLIAPELQTFRVERTLRSFLDDIAGECGLLEGTEKKRVDLALSSGEHLVILEFMRPGLKLDYDHINRYELYFRTIKASLRANTAGRFKKITGYIVADELDRSAVMLDKIESMAGEDMLAMDWRNLFDRALSNWEEFLYALASREPKDDRLKTLLEMT